MARYFIEDVRVGMAKGGFACGPVDGPVIGEAKVRTDNGEVFFMSLGEAFGIPNFIQTERSTYDEQMQPEWSDEFTEYINSNTLSVDSYEDVWSDAGEELNPLMHYLTYIVRSGWDECRPFMEATQGKWLDEIEIPVSEEEQEYLEELAEEADEE